MKDLWNHGVARASILAHQACTHAMYPSLTKPTSRMPPMHVVNEIKLDVDRIPLSQPFDNAPITKVI